MGGRGHRVPRSPEAAPEGGWAPVQGAAGGAWPPICDGVEGPPRPPSTGALREPPPLAFSPSFCPYGSASCLSVNGHKSMRERTDENARVAVRSTTSDTGCVHVDLCLYANAIIHARTYMRTCMRVRACVCVCVYTHELRCTRGCKRGVNDDDFWKPGVFHFFVYHLAVWDPANRAAGRAFTFST